jgi:cytosine/adenosine deaminase-related metal-dependent hydrolase
MQVYSADWVLPVDSPPIRDGAVRVDDGRIAAVGTAEELGTGTRYECAAIVPGFVNAHTHLEYAVYGGFGDGLGDFAEWIALHVARKDRIGWDEFVAIARLGAAECLASGITTVGDCSYSGATARACDELGLRAVVYLEVFGADPDGALARFESLRERVADSFTDRVRLGVSPHAPYTVTLDVYRACASLGLPVQTHLSESRSELRYLEDGSGPWGGYRQLLVPPSHVTGPRMLADAGLLDERWSAAHCVEVESDEIELLAATGTGVVHCPRSNGLLGCGVAPVAALRAAGVRVGLGTDSPASAPSFDPFEELRTALVLARSRERSPEALSATDALALATLGSARALGLEREIGSLAPGKRADLTVVSLEGSAYHPWEDPAAALVFGGSPDRVITTLVDGEARYERGGFEWHELRQRAASARSRMLAAPPRAAVAGS